jgi:coenzyme F420 hydrogenase subunit beta
MKNAASSEMQSKNYTQKRNIANQAFDNIVCTGCGTCAGICPTGAIKMAVKDAIYVPTVFEDECNNCGICTASCPQSHSGEEQPDSAVRKEDTSALLGAFSETYLAYARDHAVRYGAASGGVVTALLIYALEKGIITGALVTRMKKDLPLEPEPFIARTREEVVEASTSKYCPVPANVGLKEILSSSDGEKFAVVGSPCHIRGIRAAEKTNKKLNDKIVLHFGLFCSHTHNFQGTQFLLNSFGLREDEVARVFYRGFGWPGKTKIALKDGTERVLDHGSGDWGFLYNSFFFTPPYCLYCNDLTAERADISFGDPWIPEITAQERTGKSVVIARNRQASRLLERRDLNENVELCSIRPEKIVQSQQAFLHFKKVNLAHRVRFARLFGDKADESISAAGRTSLWNVPVGLLSLFNNKYGPQFVSLTRAAPSSVKLWVSAFYLMRSLAIKRDARYLQ